MFSFWQKDALTQHADVVIIGAGFMGLWSAYELKCQYPHSQITVLEKTGFPSGASVRNAGFACFGSPGEMLADAEKMGADYMWQIVEQRYKGIQKLRSVLGDDAIGYDDCGGFECFNDHKLYEKVAAGLDWLNKGMEAITGIDAAFIPADYQLQTLGLKDFQHLVANNLEGGLHSGKAVQILLQKVAAAGVNIYFQSEVINYEQLDEGDIIVVVDNDRKWEIKTSRLLITVNGFTQTFTNTNVQPARGQVLMTEPIERLKLNGTFHFDEGYYYWRNVGNRILLGGARNTDFIAENTILESVSDKIQEALLAFLHRHIEVPKEVKIEHQWAGIMAFTENKQPQVQRIAPSVWTAVACSGMGVALAPSFAVQVAAEMFAINKTFMMCVQKND